LLARCYVYIILDFSAFLFSCVFKIQAFSHLFLWKCKIKIENVNREQKAAMMDFSTVAAGSARVILHCDYATCAIGICR